MKDRVPTYPGRVLLTPVEGVTNTYTLERADEPTTEGTLLNKATLLADATATQLGLSSSDPTVNEALAAAMPLNRGIWYSRTAVPGVALGSSINYDTSKGNTSTARYFGYADSVTVNQFGTITASDYSLLKLTYATVGTYASSLKGKYFWPSTSSGGAYSVGTELYYGTGTITGIEDTSSTSSSRYYIRIPCQPVYPALTTGSWSGTFSDSDSAHTRGISGGMEYQFTPAELTGAPPMKIARGVYAGTSDSDTTSGTTVATLSCGMYPLILLIVDPNNSRIAYAMRGSSRPNYEAGLAPVSLTWNATGITVKTSGNGKCNFAAKSQNYVWTAIGL